jgi:hypothetical protein
VRTIVDADGAPIDTSEWVGVVSKSHRAKSKADLYRAGSLVVPDLQVVTFNTTFDRSAGARGRGTATIVSRDEDITAWGDELRLWRGLRLRPRSAYGAYIDYLTGGGEYLTGGGTFLVVGDDFELFGEDVEERYAYISLGFMAVQDSDRDGESLAWELDFIDRSQFVADALLDDVVQWYDGDILEIRIEEMIREALPSIPFASSYEGAIHMAAPVVHDLNADPWQIILDSAEANACEAYFDSNGTFVWRPEPDLGSAESVATFTTGQGGNIIAKTTKVGSSRRNAFNAAPVAGNNSDAAANYFANAKDENASSNMNYNGPFGKKPMRMVRDEQVNSQDKADASSAAKLAANVGMERTVRFSAVPNALVEPGDAFTFVHERLEMSEVVLMETQSIGSVESPMPVTARTRRTVTA